MRSSHGLLAVGIVCLIVLRVEPALAQGAGEGPALQADSSTPFDSSTTFNSSTPFDSSGFYLWLGAGTGLEVQIADSIAAIAGRAESSSSTGFNGSLGGGGRWVQGEIRFEYLPAFSLTAPAAPLTGAIEYDTLVATANARLTYPAGRFQPYLIAGVGFSRVTVPLLLRSSSYDLAVRGGGGLNVWFTKYIALDVDVTYVWTGNHYGQPLDYVSIAYGLLFKY